MAVKVLSNTLMLLQYHHNYLYFEYSLLVLRLEILQKKNSKLLKYYYKRQIKNASCRKLFEQYTSMTMVNKTQIVIHYINDRHYRTNLMYSTTELSYNNYKFGEYVILQTLIYSYLYC